MIFSYSSDEKNKDRPASVRPSVACQVCFLNFFGRIIISKGFNTRLTREEKRLKGTESKGSAKDFGRDLVQENIKPTQERWADDEK